MGARHLAVAMLQNVSGYGVGVMRREAVGFQASRERLSQIVCSFVQSKTLPAAASWECRSKDVMACAAVFRIVEQMKQAHLG